MVLLIFLVTSVDTLNTLIFSIWCVDVLYNLLVLNSCPIWLNFQGYSRNRLKR